MSPAVVIESMAQCDVHWKLCVPEIPSVWILSKTLHWRYDLMSVITPPLEVIDCLSEFSFIPKACQCF